LLAKKLTEVLPSCLNLQSVLEFGERRFFERDHVR